MRPMHDWGGPEVELSVQYTYWHDIDNSTVV